MRVENDKVVSVSYVLEVQGQVADKASSDSPLEYIHGSGMLLPKFEANLDGKEAGETFSFTLTPEEGYGEYNDKLKVELPLEAFKVNGELRMDMLQIGATLPMLNSEGHVVNGKVLSIDSETVSMDFNHPMAGQTLNFSGKVESIRAATEKELTEGLHGEFLPHHSCDCGGGCCCGESHDDCCGHHHEH